jgi:hypothetical protein
MRRIINSLALAAMAAIILAGCGLFTVEGRASTSAGAAAVEAKLVRELASALRATAKYHNVMKAIDDGYVDINVFIPNMGFHYLKPAILDGTFEADKPELLVYSATRNGRLRLVAVEYAVPIDLSPAAPPEGFTGHSDHWHRNEEFGLWTLHAWIWTPNPDGLFAEFNPKVP